MSHAARIQIVEDQYVVAQDCERCLTQAGFECTGFATTATNAFDLAERDRPDLILMDVRLASRIDGVDAAIAIFERLGIRSLFISAHADQVMREQARLARPLGWLNKPYTQAELVQAIRAAVAELEVEKKAQHEALKADAAEEANRLLG